MSTVKGTRRKEYLTEDMATLCAVCGKRFKMLGRHVIVHGFSAHSYKLNYSLPLSVGLVGSETFERLSSSKTAFLADNPDHLVKLRIRNPPGGRPPRGPARGTLASNLPVRAKAYRDSLRASATDKWETRKVEFTSMWDAGVSLKTMGEHFNCKASTIRNWVRNWGLPRRKMVFVQVSVNCANAADSTGQEAAQ